MIAKDDEVPDDHIETEYSPSSRRHFLMQSGATALGLGLSRLMPSGLAAVRPLPIGPSGIGRVGPNGFQSDKLIVHSVNPQDLETPIELLNSFITPNDLFYVRCHLYTPKVDLNDWSLKIDGMVAKEMTLKLEDLKRFAETSQTVTLECSGNGRAFYEPAVPGAQWLKGAVGNAKWTGVKLADVMKSAGIKAEGKYLTFDGADKPMGKVPDFIRSLPLEKAMHPDTLLAYEMNGEPIPVPHGFPLRLIVPGWTGNNNVKWVTHITVTDAPSDAFFMKTAYRFPTRTVAPGGSIDPSMTVPLMGLAVKSSITGPSNGAQVKPGPVKVTGIAYAGEADITGVDISTDLGRTWSPAALGREHAHYAWRLFEHTWNAKDPGFFVIMSRAKDSQGRVQPMVQNWNPSGYLWNVADRIKVTVNNG
ncbi:MAG: sulfite oxidase [Blastocatellia bacterium]